jgi:hypothetical protein
MTTDDTGTPEEPSSLSGDVVPDGPGEWLTLKDAEARTGAKHKTLYRRAKRGQMRSRIDVETGLMLVWVPAPVQELSSPSVPEEQRSLSVPDAPERFAAMIAEANAQATAPLVARIEELIRENEELRRERQQEPVPRSLWRELRSLIRSLIG